MQEPGTTDETSVANRYWVPVDPSAENNAHAFELELIGHGKRVLELGPAAGHVTRALVRQGCEVVGIEIDPEAAAALEGVAECVVGDLSDTSLIAKAAEGGLFDVVLAGDVLEHLPDPLAVLRASRDALRSDGFVVTSLPNVAHADVALGLLQGRFEYRDQGLLDRTHLRFFTIDSVRELMRDAGFQMVDLRRVRMPVFGTELGLEPSAFPAEVVEAALASDEAETYQFIVQAVPHSGDQQVARLAERCLAAEEALDAEQRRRASQEAELQQALTQAEAELRSLQERTDAETTALRDQLALQQEHIDSIMSTKTMRAVAPLRALYANVRRLASAPPD